MGFLVTVALIGFVPVSLLTFAMVPARRAILLTYLGGWMFLPQAGFQIGGLPDYDKAAAIAFAGLLGTVVKSPKLFFQTQPRWFDLPMLMFCIWPFFSHVFNGHTPWSGLNWVIVHLCLWGIPYLLGRIYFRTDSEIRELAIAVFIGGLIYMPLCWFEIRFSPQLHLRIYGFFQHSFLQHIRYGGFRPILFMQHGIMVGTWMAAATLVGFWLWRDRVVDRIWGVRMRWWVPLMFVTTIFCKVASALGVLGLGLVVLLGCRNGYRVAMLTGLALSPLIYIATRSTGLWSGENLLAVIALVDQERSGSLGARMKQEGFYVQHAMSSPLFGFADGDFVPVDDDGNAVTRGNDGFWIINLGLYGLISLLAVFTSLSLPAFRIARRRINLRYGAKALDGPALALAVVVMMFSIDCLINGMINPIYLLCAGAVQSVALQPLTHDSMSSVASQR